MKKLLIALSLTPLLTFAGEYENSVGLGHQYGGILGAQFSYKTESSKYYGSVGLIGVAAGFQTTFSDNSKYSYGFVLGKEELQSEDGFLFITYNYHLSGFSNNGFVIGAGVGVTREDESGFFGDVGQTTSSSAITLDLGYKF